MYTHELQEIIKKKEAVDFQKTLPDKKRIHELLYDFVRSHDVVLYGGIALNTLLPENIKFYGPEEFPDFDCLSASAKKTAKALVNLLVKNGFKYSEVRSAIHTNTFKVFVNFEAVADFTQVSPTFFAGIKKLVVKKDQLQIAPTFLLKHYVLKELARPDGSAYRWQKVYKRSMLLDKLVQPQLKCKDSSILAHKMIHFSDDELTIMHRVMDVIKKLQLPLVGNLGLAYLLDPMTATTYQCCKQDTFFSTFEVLSMNPDDTFQDIKQALGGSVQLRVSRRFYYQEVLPKRLRIFYKLPSGEEVKLMTIIHTDHNCFSVIKKKGLVIGSPYTILHLLYSYWIVYYVYESKKIHNYVLDLITALENYIDTLPIKEKFLLDCYGVEKTLLNVKRERWCKGTGEFVYRPSI